jgi:hypothetical protein
VGVPLLLLLGPGASNPADAGTIPIPGARPIVEWQDPFWQGASVQASYADRESAVVTDRELDLTLGYGWDTGLAVTAQVPFVLADTPPIVNGATAPRLAGGATNTSQRLMLTGLFRFWGDPYDYVAVKIGAGLPYQFDGAIQDSRFDSWTFPLSLAGRIDGSWIALSFLLTDAVSTPAAVVGTGAAAAQLYADGTNVVSASGSVIFYPSSRIDLSLQFNEVFPSSVDVGSNDTVRAYVSSVNHISRVQTASIGVGFAPLKQGLVLSGIGSFNLPSDQDANPPISITGTVRWVF